MPRHYLLLIAFYLTFSLTNCSNEKEPEFKLDLSFLRGKIYTYSFYHVTTSRFLQKFRSDTMNMEINLEIESSQGPLNILKLTFRDLQKSRLPPEMKDLKGTRSGFAIINYSSGLPYVVETRSSLTTTTTDYEVREEDHWIINLKRTDNNPSLQAGVKYPSLLGFSPPS